MENKQTKNVLNILAVCILYVLGNLIITAPFKEANEYTLLVLMSLAALGILLSIILVPIFRKILNFNAKSNALRLFLIIFCVGVAVYALFCAAKTFFDMLEFARLVVLPETAVTLVGLALALGVLWFAVKTRQTLLKFALIFAVFGAVVITVFFVGLFENYNFKNIYIFNLPNAKTYFGGVKAYIGHTVLPLIPLFAFIGLENKKSRTKATFLGVLLGFILLILCIAGSILLFGPNLAGELKFAYSQFISTFTVGRLYTRLDFLAYFIFFVASITKIWVLGQTVKELLGRINSLFLLFNRG